jgi:hypothetical protein
MSPLAAVVLIVLTLLATPLIVSELSAWSHSPARRHRLAVKAHQKAVARRRANRRTA